MDNKFDVVVIGGGAAGLAASSVLARANRKTLLIDAGEQSNLASRASHGVFGHDDVSPQVLYDKARQQLSSYAAASYVNDTATDIEPEGGAFLVTTLSGKRYITRKIILAQGVKITLPDINGLSSLWGTKAWHCPFCDGYEYRAKKLLIIADRATIDHLSVILPSWSRDLHWSPLGQDLSTDTKSRILASGGALLGQVTKVSDTGPVVQAEFSNGSKQEFAAVVVGASAESRNELADKLRCRRTSEGVVERNDDGATTVDGVYVAGDQTDIVRQVNVAAASGHKVAAKIVEQLAHEDRLSELKDWQLNSKEPPLS